MSIQARSVTSGGALAESGMESKVLKPRSVGLSFRNIAGGGTFSGDVRIGRPGKYLCERVGP